MKKQVVYTQFYDPNTKSEPEADSVISHLSLSPLAIQLKLFVQISNPDGKF